MHARLNYTLNLSKLLARLKSWEEQNDMNFYHVKEKIAFLTGSTRSFSRTSDVFFTFTYCLVYSDYIYFVRKWFELGKWIQNVFSLLWSVLDIVIINSFCRGIHLLTQIRKYKEDDITNSNAVDYSQDVCIYFLHEAPTCHPRSFGPPSPLYTSQPGSQPETLKTITTPSQPWLLHDGDSDTKIDADSAYI